MIDDTSFETHRQQETKDQIRQLGRIIVEQHAELERLKQYACQCEESVHSTQEGYAELQAEIEQLKADRDKWEYLCKIAHKAFDESNVKKMYGDMHQADIEELNRMLHQIAILKALLTRAAEALENLDVGSFVHGRPLGLIAELRKAAE